MYLKAHPSEIIDLGLAPPLDMAWQVGTDFDQKDGDKVLSRFLQDHSDISFSRDFGFIHSLGLDFASHDLPVVLIDTSSSPFLVRLV